MTSKYPNPGFEKISICPGLPFAVVCFSVLLPQSLNSEFNSNHLSDAATFKKYAENHSNRRY